MKTKRTNRITSLVLAIVMLASVFSIPAFAEEEGKKEPTVYANVDFEGVTVNQVEVPPEEGSPEGTPSTFKEGTSIDPQSAALKGAHTYVSIAEDEAHGKYVVIPFRGNTDDKSGNYDKTLTVQHPEVSYADAQGVTIELDLYVEHHPRADESDPTVEFQFQSLNHDPVSDKSSTAWVTFGQLNLRTGDFSLISAAKVGAKGVKQGQWNKIRFELDLGNGRFDIYINDVQYAVYGSLGNSNNVKNVVLPASKLLIAKTNKNNGAYCDDASVADTEMTHVAVDNIKFYENVDFIPPEVEPEVLYAIFNDSLQSKPVGMNPKLVGYKYAPNTAKIVSDPTKPGNNAVRVDIKGNGASKYYLWSHTNQGNEAIVPNADYNPDDPENFPEYNIVDGVMTATTKKGGTITAKIWGDDDNEKTGKPTDDYIIQSMAGVKDDKKQTCNWYFVTGNFCDAQHGAGNVAAGLQPSHPEILSADHDTVVLNVDYYFSPDAYGKIEVQMQGSFALKDDPNTRTTGTWIDIVVFEALKDNDTIAFVGMSNYLKVCGSSPIVKKGEWFTLSAVLDMKTGWEDIYINGSYCFTQKPRDSYSIGGNTYSESELCFYGIQANTLSVGKIQRQRNPETLDGFYMIDNVNFSTGEVLLGAQYEKNYVENFDDLEIGATDFSDTGFGMNVPSSVVVAGDDTHAKALKLALGEQFADEAVANALVLYRTGSSATTKFYRVKSVDEEDSVLLEDENYPDPIKVTGRGNYKVGDEPGYILGTYKDYVNYWAVYEDGTAATNVDKQWYFHNPGISYATKTRVATDVEIFVPEDASGVITAQISKGAGYGSDGKKVDFTFKALYTIDFGNGIVNLGGSISSKDSGHMATLNKGEWNTVSIAINMVTGETELYVNSFYAGTSNLGVTQVAFYENTWILAKVSRKVDQEDYPLNGYILIDDARFFTVTNQLITVDSKLENVTEVKFNGEIVPDGTKLFITEDVPYETTKFDTSAYYDVISSEDGYSGDPLVSVRSNKPIGLRFTSYVDTDLLSELLEEYDGTVTFGTVILPSSSISTVDEVTRPELDLRGIEYLDVRTDCFYTNEYVEEAYDYDFEGIFAGSIIGLKEANLSRDFSAIGYVEIALESGGSIVIYTEVMSANLAKLAQEYLDSIDDIPDDVRWVLEGFAIGRYPAGYEKDYTDPSEELPSDEPVDEPVDEPTEEPTETPEA